MKSSFLPENPVVLGAGPGGLGMAWKFSRAGIPCTILEGEKIGGLSRTFEDKGYFFDFGPHVIHPKYPEIKSFIENLVRSDLLVLDFSCRILFLNRQVPYPFKGREILTALPIHMIIPAGINFLWARMKMFLRDPKIDDNFEDWITNRFGKYLYNIYFGPYAEKVWKVPGKEISDYVAIRRVPVLSLRDQIRQLVGLERKNTHSEDGFVETYYFKKGVGQLCQAMAKGIKKNGKIINPCKITKIIGNKNIVRSIEYVTDGKTHKVPADFLFSTIPIPDLIPLFQWNVPQHVQEAARQLDYCSEILLYLKLKRDVDVPSLLYFSDKDIRINRVYNIGLFSRECVPKGKTALCFEFTCNIGDSTWNSPKEELVNDAIEILRKLNILTPDDVEGASIKKVSHAYPRFRKGYEMRLRTIFDYLKQIKNLITYGRQGLFNYANIDDVLHMAFRAFESLSTVKDIGVDYSYLFPEYLNFDEARDSYYAISESERS